MYRPVGIRPIYLLNLAKNKEAERFNHTAINTRVSIFLKKVRIFIRNQNHKRMKRIVLALVVLCCCMGLRAQRSFYYGGVFGIGQASFNSDALAGQTDRLMVGGGVAGTYHFNNFFGLVANGLVVSKGTRATGTVPASGPFSSPEDYEETYRMLYAEIPVMAKLRFGGRGFYAKVFGGPSFNFNIDGTYDIDYKSSTNKDVSGQKINNLKVMETALVYGAGVEVQTGGAGLYSLEVRMSQGLSSIAKTTMGGKDIKSEYFSICLGWSLN